jgi:UDP-N-acetylglucosamine 2-epimerase (non-hydrolysing)
MKTVDIIIGTRPEAVKMAPVYIALKQNPGLKVRLVSTGQHRDLLLTALESFGLAPDVDLKVMRENQSLSSLTAEILLGLEKLFTQRRPDLILTHGDTTTCYAAALSAFYHKIPFYHVEAGLRSYRLDSPFPEEFNRQSVAKIAAHHFAPSENEKENLLKEGIDENKISVVGSTVFDAIHFTLANHIQSPKEGEWQKKINNFKRSVLFTVHRREDASENIKRIMTVIRDVALSYSDIAFVFPVHPNPKVKSAARAILSDVTNVILTEPLNYAQFLSVLKQVELVITDSGGVQEEAVFFGKTTLICRQATERQDGLADLAKLVGTDPVKISESIHKELKNKKRLSIVKNQNSTSSSASEIVARIIAKKGVA